MIFGEGWFDLLLGRVVAMTEAADAEVGRIRPARPDDLEAVLALTRATFAEHGERQPEWFPPSASAHVEGLILHSILPSEQPLAGWSSILLVYEDRGRILGHVCAYFSSPSEHEPGRADRFGSVCDITLAPEVRGKRIGKRLLEAALADLQEAGCTVLGAEVWHGNNASEALFRASGFTPAYVTFRRRIAPSTPLTKIESPTLWQRALRNFRSWLPILLLLFAAFVVAFFNR